MENCFYDEIERDGNNGAVRPIRASLISVAHIVRNASSLALNKFGPGKRQRALALANTLYQGTHLITHQVQALFSGLKSLASGTTRPSWNYATHMAINQIKRSLAFPHYTIEIARQTERRLSSWIDLTPTGCIATLCSFSVSTSQILRYEAEGAKYRESQDTWRYPIPAEFPLSKQDTYVIKGEWIRLKETVKQKQRKVILYLHGGAYVLLNSKLYRSATGMLCLRTSAPVLAIDYRVAPENPFPSALHDALAAYLFLIQPSHPMFQGTDLTNVHLPYLPEEIVICGDSAGAGLSMALILYLHMYLRSEDGSLIIPLPKAAVLLSPWVDLSCTSKSWMTNGSFDFLPAAVVNLHEPIFRNFQHPVYSYCFGEKKDGRELHVYTPITPHHQFHQIPKLAKMTDIETDYSMDFDSIQRDSLERFIRNPLVSPVFGNFHNLACPILIQVGECEMLLDDSKALAYKIANQNKASFVRHEVWKDMFHDFQICPGTIQGELSNGQVACFIEEVFTGVRQPLSILTEQELSLVKVTDSRVGIPII